MSENTTGIVKAATAATKPAKTKKEKVDELKKIMNAESVKEQFRNALQKNANKFIASIIDLYNNDTQLQNCEPSAVVMECLKAAVLNLPISKAMGQAYVIPYNNKQKDGTYKTVPTFQIGYKGLIQLALRTGAYRTINSGVVYEGELQRGSKLSGEINLDGRKVSDKIVGYFAYIEHTKGFRKALFMSVDEVIDHATKFSKGLTRYENGHRVNITKEELQRLASQPMSEKNNGVGWTANFHSMAIKTVMRNLLSKFGFLSVDMDMAQAIDSDVKGEAAQIEAQDTFDDASSSDVLDMEDVEFEEVGAEPDEENAEKKIEAGF